MKITYEDKELLDSKTFLALGLGETTISLGQGEETLSIILDFVEDDKEKKHDLKLIPVDRKTLKIRFTNWNNPLGTAFLEPLEIGRINHRKLFLVIYVKKAGRKGQIREITFSAYLGARDQDGTN